MYWEKYHCRLAGFVYLFSKHLPLETITDGSLLGMDLWSNLVKLVLNPCDSPLLYSDFMLRYHHCTAINSVPLQCHKADLVKCRIKPDNGRTVTF